MSSVKSYEQVIKEMNEYIEKNTRLKSDIIEWKSQYTEEFHERMLDAVSRLVKIKEEVWDEDFDVPKEDNDVIFKLGCDIHKKGGLRKQQACYYVAINFINRDAKVKTIETCWNGAGNWLY